MPWNTSQSTNIWPACAPVAASMHHAPRDEAPARLQLAAARLAVWLALMLNWLRPGLAEPAGCVSVTSQLD